MRPPSLPANRLLPPGLRSASGVLVALCFLLLSTGCQSPYSAVEARQRIQTENSGENAGFKAWRTGYRKAAERYATEPSWTPPKVPPGSLASAKTTYTRADVSQKVIAMTFDDGPHPSNTPRLLDLMKKRNIKATFFVVGQNAKAYPQILKRMIAEGHEIANHTWSHPDLTKLSNDGIRREFNTTRDAIVSATGIQPRVSRPPYGAINTGIKNLLKDEYGYPSILWSVDPLDWKRPGASVVASRLVDGAQPGGILLAHDIHSPTIDAMPSTFDRLLAQGYKFVTVSQLIQLEQAGSNAQLLPSSSFGDAPSGLLAVHGLDFSEPAP